MTEPLVSVIVPVYNCRDTVESALESALTQTLPPDRVEVIAVDDGSTDGSAELLDEMARAHDRLTVVHQPNSGGAGAPRNKGLDLASGTFVFFLDADDRLGPEALARMTAMAERNGTDIVLGKQVGTGGRKVPRVFERTIERTHVLDPDCDLFPKISMAALQLFRRSLIEDAGLRFTEGVLSHEDQLFTAGAYLNASGVSVLADYECYYWAARMDGTSSTQLGGARSAEVHAIARQAMDMIAERVGPGELRERLHYRYLLLEVFGRLEQLYLTSAPHEQKTMLTGCRDLLSAWSTPRLLTRYNAMRRVIAHCLLHGLDAEVEEILRFHRSETHPGVLVEEGRAFVRYPYFRGAALGIPDACFATSLELRSTLTKVAWERSALVVGGTVVIRGVHEASPEVHLVVEHADGARHRVACTTRPGEPSHAGLVTPFTATLQPPSPSWADGVWTLNVEAALKGHVLTLPLTKPRGLKVPRAVLVPADGGYRLVRPRPVSGRSRGPLAIEVGGALTSYDLKNIKVTWASGRLRVAGEPPPVLPFGPPPAFRLLLERPGDSGTAVRAPLSPDPDRPEQSIAEVPPAGLRRGRWTLSFQVDGVGHPVRLRVPDGEDFGPVTASVMPPRRARVRLNPMTVDVTFLAEARLRRAVRCLTHAFDAAKTPSRHAKEDRA
ncbi:glycosyltransferase family 2 protein [Actinomadura sp. SCN-SB]|uniref:glycosyltransferase family 2 protein n=1 Tax=Actinomadura sp. SCN-SB TaxID=3373092 RepID=UPI00375119D6